MSLAGDGTDAQPGRRGWRPIPHRSMRDDGSWPIDTNLATWVTTLSIGALADADVLVPEDAPSMRQWLLGQQSTREHPFTHAAPGAWAWTPLSGGVPDADDTSRRAPGAAAAWRSRSAHRFRGCGRRSLAAGRAEPRRRHPDVLPRVGHTRHSIAALLRSPRTRCRHGARGLRTSIGPCSGTCRAAAARAVQFLAATQRTDGTWIPLWFGNEHAPDEDNPAYGTARVLLGPAFATGSRRSGGRGVPPARRRVAPRGSERGRRLGRKPRGSVVNRGNGRRAGCPRPFDR